MKKNSSFYICFFIILISMFFGVAISSVHFTTLAMLKKNETLHKNRIISKAFMLDVKGDSPKAYQEAVTKNINIDVISIKNQKIKIFKDKKRGNIGFLFKGMGFWEPISGIIVLESNLKQVINIQILEQKETPGLGARIEEKWFTDQFKNLNIDWKSKDKKIIVGSGGKKKNNSVDGITGATQTSMALMKILNDDLKKFKKFYKSKG